MSLLKNHLLVCCWDEPVRLVLHHGGSSGWERAEEDDAGHQEVGVCGGKGEGNGPAEGPAAHQKVQVRGTKRLAGQDGGLVRSMVDADDAISLV